MTDMDLIGKNNRDLHFQLDLMCLFQTRCKVRVVLFSMFCVNSSQERRHTSVLDACMLNAVLDFAL